MKQGVQKERGLQGYTAGERARKGMGVTLTGLHCDRPDNTMTLLPISCREGAGQMVLGATWNNRYPMRHMAPELQEGAKESPTLCRERKYEQKTYHQH